MRWIAYALGVALLWHVSDNMTAYFEAWPVVERERTEQARWLAMQECLRGRDKWCERMIPVAKRVPSYLDE